MRSQYETIGRAGGHLEAGHLHIPSSSNFSLGLVMSPIPTFAPGPARLMIVRFPLSQSASHVLVRGLWEETF